MPPIPVDPDRKPAARTLDLYRAIWRHAAGARGQYAGAMALLGLATSLKLAVPLLAGAAINALQRSGASALAQAGLCIAGVIGVYLGVWLLHGPGRVLERNVGLRVRAALSDALFARLMRLPLAWHEGEHSGEVQQRTRQATGALYEFTQTQFIYLQNAINLVGPLTALTLISAGVGGMALAGYVLLGAIIVRFDRRLMRLAHEQNGAERRYAAGLLDFLGNVHTVMSLRLAEPARRLVDRRLQAVFRPLRSSIVVNEAKWCAVDLLSVGLTWSLVAVYAWRAHGADTGAQALQIGSLFMVYQYAQQAAGVIGSMATNFQNFARIRTDFAGADPIWDAAERPPHAPAVAPGWRRVEARGLSFEYANAGRGGVHEVALHLARGERVALIGPSGSGKSTLLRLIAGLYEPRHGYYSVDGEPLFGARSLAAVATLIPQDAEIFEGSVRENLGFGEPRAERLLLEAAHLSAFDEVLAGLPAGLDAAVAERGANFSGGQRQRLALARGLVAAHGSSLLLLDEPTSALDQATESRVLARLRRGLPDACIVAAVHRLSALEHFDRVVLMHAGRVVDSGTADELAARQPLFRELRREPQAVGAARSA